jgi:serine/threonine protein phosphatase PrpC
MDDGLFAYFTVQSRLRRSVRLPREDYYRANKTKNVFVVADGTARDSSLVLPDISTLRGISDFSAGYPPLRSATMASEYFCDTFLRFIVEGNSPDASTVRDAFRKANNDQAEWNRSFYPQPDFLVNDLASCRAAGAVVLGNTVHYGFIGDCRVGVFDKDCEIRFLSEDQGINKHRKEIWEIEGFGDKTWKDPDVRRIVRSKYRNKPDNPLSFGMVTGEPEVMSYVVTGSLEVFPDEKVVLFTEGIDKILRTHDFYEALKRMDCRTLESVCSNKVSLEGTLIAYQVPRPKTQE